MSLAPCSTAVGYFRPVETTEGTIYPFSPTWAERCDNDPQHRGPFFCFNAKGSAWFSPEANRVLCGDCWVAAWEARQK